MDKKNGNPGTGGKSILLKAEKDKKHKGSLHGAKHSGGNFRDNICPRARSNH